MRRILQSLRIGTLVLVAISGSLPVAVSTPAFADTAAPVRLWDGFSAPVGMAFDAGGYLYVAEWSAGRVTRIDPAGKRSVFADGLSGPSGLAIGPDGAIYVASYSRDEVYRFTPAGARSVHVTGLATPAGLSFDRGGRLLIANRRTNQIVAVTSAGGLDPVIEGLRTPVGVVQIRDGGHVVANLAGGITIIRRDGTRIEAGAGLATPGPGIAVTADDRVFVVDYGGTTIREIRPDGRNRIIAEGLGSPVGLTLSPDGVTLLTATWGDGAIHRIAIPPGSSP